jgi:hypothetical protein
MAAKEVFLSALLIAFNWFYFQDPSQWLLLTNCFLAARQD